MKSFYLSFLLGLLFSPLAGQNPGQLSKLATQYSDAFSANDKAVIAQLAKQPSFEQAVAEYEQYINSLETATKTNLPKSDQKDNMPKGILDFEKTGCTPDFEDGFESGSHLPTWTELSSNYTWSVNTNDPAQGTYSLEQTGKTEFYKGLKADFPTSQPEAFSWWVKPTYEFSYHNHIVIGDENITSNNGILFAYYYTNEGGFRFYANQNTNFTFPISLNTWYFIEIKDIDWTNKHFDIYIDHVLIQADFPFRSNSSNHVNKVHLFNLTGGANVVANYDEILIGCEPVPFQPFITTWKTDNPGPSNSTSITIPTTGTGYNYDVDWENDGTFDDLGVTGNITHDYGTAGTYTVAIRGDFPRIFFNYTGDRSKILTIEQWGDIQWSSMNSAFSWADNLTENATDAPDLSNVTSMEKMFHKATNFDGDLNNWDVSNVTDMNALFAETDQFNGNISDWDVSSVTDFSFAFDNAEKFNQDLNNWDVSSATEMHAMFQSTTDFNGNISNWDVSSVTDFSFAFNIAEKFNQDLSNWDVSNVTNMVAMFSVATAFNQDLGNWNIKKVTFMSSMLSFSGMDVTNYDNTLIGWATQNVKPNISFNADELEYCAGDAARSLLINTHGWDITDDAPLLDGDGDEFCSTSSGGSDCNDNDAAIHPDALEVCDDIDNDCNGMMDDHPDCAVPFTCSATFFQVRESSLYQYEYGASDFTLLKANLGYDIDALAFNPNDNFLYGVTSDKKVVLIDADGMVFILSDLPINAPIVYGGDINANEIFRLQIRSTGNHRYAGVNVGNSPPTGAGSKKQIALHKVNDFSFNPVDGYFYGIKNENLVKIDPSTGDPTFHTISGGFSGNSHSTWMTKDQQLYIQKSGGNIFRIDGIAAGGSYVATYVDNLPISGPIDGASCPMVGTPFCDVSITIVNKENVPCSGDPVGSIELNHLGGSSPYTYDWADLPGNNDPLNRTGLSVGEYTISITDNNGCVKSETIEIETGFTNGRVYVDENATGMNNGTSWQNAFNDLQDAILNNCPGFSEIWVAKGTYQPTAGTDRTASFILKNNIAIFGGFEMGNTSLMQRDWENNKTILSGDIGIQGDSTDNSYHVVFNDGGGINATAVIDGFIIEKGNADGLGENEKGSGMFNDNASPTVRNCHFKNNNAKFGGGSMFNKTSAAVIDNCQFSNNTAEIGGGVFNSIDATAKFTNCYFYENNASNSGGGMFNNSALLCTVTNCTFENNSATTDGGGIYNLDSSPDIINSVFSANTANEGAGISNRSVSSPNIVNCSFHVNEAASYGGGIRNHTGTVPLITNCIIWGNSAGIADDEISNAVPGPIVSYSIIKQVSGTYPGTGNLNVDPLFVSSNDLSLQPCSPAIDTGLNSANGTVEDLLGNNRKMDAKGNGLAHIDMGAFEYQGDLTLPNIFTGMGNGTDWSDPLNWSDGFVPKPCRAVLIQSGNNVVLPLGMDAYGNTLDIETGATMETMSSATMEIGN